MSTVNASSSLSLPSFEQRARVRQVGAARVVSLQTPVRSVVSWRGSITAYPDFAAGEELVQELAVAMLDRGTRRRDRFAVAELVDRHGAKVHFTSAENHVVFTGRALREDVPDMLRLVAEQLAEPLFDPDEFTKAREQLAASLKRTLENTGAQATAALTRALYGKGHPNFTPTVEASLAHLREITLEEVRAYHERHFGAHRLFLALAGDVDEAAVDVAVADSLGAWRPVELPARFEAEAAPGTPGRRHIPMPDKQNVDVRMGHALSLRRQDADFIPVFVANYILGGNFSARLMATVRDEMGLTYGIRSNLMGITTVYDGYWRVGVTLSGENVERGIEATLREVRRFVEQGVTAEEVAEKKTTISGSFKVELATTAGLALGLWKNLERGFGVGYLDRFPEDVARVDTDAVNDAIPRYFHPDRLAFVSAGMLDPAPEASS